MAEHGINIMVYAGEGASTPSLIGGTKSNDIQTDAEMIKKASSTQQSWDEYTVGRKSWTLNTSFLVVQTGHLSSIGSILKVGNTFTLEWRKRGTAAALLYGTAFLKTARINSQLGNLVTGSFSFQGTGELHAPE